MKEGRASRTAEYVALFRAIESSRPADRRLFEDPFAQRFLRPRFALLATICRLPGVAALVSRYIDRRWAGARSSAVARTRFIDDTVESALGRGIGQVVILGAGFDSRAYRLRGLSDVPVFEVDHPATLARKQARLGPIARNAGRAVRFVGVDFQLDDMRTAMLDAGYSEEIPALLLWEGVTNYLSEAAVDATLRWCGRQAPGSQLVFTYIDRAVLDDPRSFAGTDELFATLEAVGERWTFGIDPSEVEGFVRGRGLKLERDVGSAEYRARYLAKSIGLAKGYEFYRIAIASVPEGGTAET